VFIDKSFDRGTEMLQWYALKFLKPNKEYKFETFSKQCSIWSINIFITKQINELKNTKSSLLIMVLLKMPKVLVLRYI
jgi:hypothetical protein